MAKIQNPTKVITGVNTRWSYANVWDIPVSTAELPSISTLSTVTATRELLAVSIISRSFETVNLLAASPELRMISLLMKKTISLNKSNVTTTTKQAVIILLPPVTIKESR